MSLKDNGFEFGVFFLDSDERALLKNGIQVPLTPKAYDLLLELIKHPGGILLKGSLMDSVWAGSNVEDGNLTFTMAMLRKALGDDAARPTYIETIPKHGYRFIGSVKEHKRPERGIMGLPVAAHSARWRRPASVGVGFALIVAIVLWLLWSRPAQREDPRDGKVMVAILPIRNLTGDPNQDYFSDGLTEEMITRLGNLSSDHLGVIGRTSVMHFKNDQATVEQIGRELKVQYVLEGSIRRDADRVRIAAQLIQTKDQTKVWSQEYDRELTNLLSLQDEIAQKVANEIQSTFGRKQSNPRQTSDTMDYEAYDLFLRGKYFLNQRNVAGFERAIDYFQQATIRDPNYARAYAGLADCYALIGGYGERPQRDLMPLARAAATKAVEIDPDLAEAHAALALIVQNYDRDWQTSEKEFRRAIELDPNYATGHHWYAEHLTWLGRFDEALGESERARQLDPLSLIIAADNGAILYYSRQYDRAITQFLAVREMDPNFARSGLIRSAYEETGSFSIAEDEIEEWRRKYGDEPWALSELAYAYGRSGDHERAQQALQKLLEVSRRRPVDPEPLVWAYLGVGNKDRTFAYLEDAYAHHSNILITLKVEPRFDPLRRDPRFQDLLSRLGLA